MEGLGVVYEQEEPAVESQQTPAGDNQAAVTSVPGEETEDDEEIRALAGNPDDLDATQQLQPPPQQIPQHHDVSGGYGDYTQSSGQHPQQQMEHHGGYDKNGGSTQPGKLFIGGVSWETTEETLRQHFGKYGALTDAALMKDKYTGQPRGFGFVTFADASAIDRVLEETHTLDGRSVEVKRAIPREKTAPGGSSDFRGGRGGYSGGFTEQKKIFVGGLAPTVTEQDFRHYFEEFGKITDAVVMIDRDTQRSRGFGFITFEEESSVAEVISKNHEIHGKSVEIKRAEPKEARAGGGGGYGGRGGRGGGWRGGGRGASGGYNGGAYGGGGYGGGYGGGGYGGSYGAGYGGGYGAAAAYGGGYGGYPQSYAGYGYGGYGGGRGGYGYGGYAGYGGYGGAGAEGAGQEGGAGGEEGGYSEEGAQQGGQGGAAGGYGYGYRQGGGSGGAQGGSGGRSDRYRPY